MKKNLCRGDAVSMHSGKITGIIYPLPYAAMGISNQFQGPSEKNNEFLAA